jgi:hypothetical protein
MALILRIRARIYYEKSITKKKRWAYAYRFFNQLSFPLQGVKGLIFYLKQLPALPDVMHVK